MPTLPTLSTVLVPLFAITLTCVAVMLLVPCLMLLTEAAAAMGFQPAGQSSQMAADTTLTILMPAHNEAAVIGTTLAGLVSELRPQDRIVVVADNCSDDTAAIARSAGATVIERTDTTLRGKGYALDFGLSGLKAAPPDVVVLMDADCDIQPGGVAQLASYALIYQRPVQANYLIEQPPATNLKGFISAFAIKVKNLVRPLGLQRLRAPSLLTGTGIALPWNTALVVSIASGHIAEDMKWGLDLALAGHPPTFLSTVQVTSRLPSEDEAAKVQRTRWEHGHLQIIRDYLPTLVWQSFRQRRVDLLALALELSILPLSLLVIVWAGVTGVALVFGLLGQVWLPFRITLMAGMALFSGVALAWYRYGRSDISLRQLAMIPVYILWKIPLYIVFLIRPQKQWIRTQRDS